ncbi:MAG: hypothetical protein R2709_14875 [Marmoricola sp.]
MSTTQIAHQVGSSHLPPFRLVNALPAQPLEGTELALPLTPLPAVATLGSGGWS